MTAPVIPADLSVSWDKLPAPWMAFAACGDTDDPEQFHPEHERDRIGLARTKLICKSCPVKSECLQYSIDEQIWYGIWGGLTENERRRLARRNGVQILRP